jgi:hypothetical protein
MDRRSRKRAVMREKRAGTCTHPFINPARNLQCRQADRSSNYNLVLAVGLRVPNKLGTLERPRATLLRLKAPLTTAAYRRGLVQRDGVRPLYQASVVSPNFHNTAMGRRPGSYSLGLPPTCCNARMPSGDTRMDLQAPAPDLPLYHEPTPALSIHTPSSDDVGAKIPACIHWLGLLRFHLHSVREM